MTIAPAGVLHVHQLFCEIMWRIFSFKKVEKPSSVFFVRHLLTSNVLLKSHYDVLGLTPKATQSDIKAAYYKLSMMYHPDKNKGDGDPSRFRDITAAYEVLGNYRLRKLYDRGLLHKAGADEATHVHENPEEKFYQSRATRHSAPSHSGKTPIYDFDEWARQHYGTSFAKRVSARARWEDNERVKVVNKGEVESELTVVGIFAITVLFIIISYLVSEPYDVDRTKEVPSEEKISSKS